MRALVTGGAGFIGGHLSERLLADGHQVICLDDLSTGCYQNMAHLATWPGFEFVPGSVLDRPLIDDLAARSDTIFHLAAAVGVELIMSRTLDGLHTNIHGTEIVLDCALRHGRRTLVASTSEVYGKSATATLREDQDRLVGSPLVRRWSYAEAKALDETLAYLFWSDRAVPTVIVRFFNVAGPRQTGRYGMVIPRFVDQALRHRPLTVYSDGNQTRSFCHVRDAVAGLIALIEHPGAYGGVFNIGRPEEVSIQQLAERVIKLSGSRSTIRHIPYREAYGDGFEDTLRRVPDISRARALVGFQPRLDLDDIILSVIEDRLVRTPPEPDRPVPVPVEPELALPPGGPDGEYVA
jgi:UDP-glucose 4-epimerase